MRHRGDTPLDVALCCVSRPQFTQQTCPQSHLRGLDQEEGIESNRIIESIAQQKSRPTMVSPSRAADVGVFGIPVNGFHPQLTAVSNPVQPNDIPPPSWPSYVPTVTSRRLEEKRNRQRGSSGSPTTSPSAATTNDEASAAAPITSEIDARTAIVVRRLQNDAKETDRSRSKMLRKRVRREERNERRHMRKRLRRHQGNQQGRRTSETTEVSFSSMSSSFSTSTRTDATTTSTTTGSSASSVATTSYGTMRASHVSSSSSTAQAATPLATEPPTTTSSESEGYGTQPISSRVEAAPIPSVDDEMHFSELYSDVFMTSNRPQFLATLGGRLVAWNEEFLAVTGIAKAQLSGCMTVHILVDSKYHAVLNDLFELALRGDADTTKSDFASKSGSVSSGKAIQTAATAATAAVVVASGEATAMSSDDSNERRIAAAMAPPSSVCLDRSISPLSDLSDDKVDLPKSFSAQHTSLVLPCVLPPQRGMGRRQVTIVLMNDVDPSRRCFYCILSPMDSSHTCGVDDLLPSVLLEPSKGIADAVFVDGISGSPILSKTQVNAVGVIRRIGDDELANLL